MKQLSDFDLENMTHGKFTPNEKQINKQVRSELKLGQLIPTPVAPIPKYTKLDFHGKTQNQAWEMLEELIKSGTRKACIITGASGILKPAFVCWITNGAISKYISEYKQLNNGSFEIKIKKIID